MSELNKDGFKPGAAVSFEEMKKAEKARLKQEKKPAKKQEKKPE